MDEFISARRVLLEDAVRLYGHEGQVLMFCEEAAEAITELSHYVRGRSTKEKVTDELADLRIMIAQMEIVLGINGQEVESAIESKLNRLAERMVLKATW